MDVQNKRPWSNEDVDRLIHMREVQKLGWRVIDATLNRSRGGSYQKYLLLQERGRRSAAVKVEGGRVPVRPEQEAERRARQEAANRMTVTAIFFGDPPPGYSALDQREANK